MDRRLKERLIGAAVLVALGVWLIPWILDGSAPLDEPAREAAAVLELPAPATLEAESLRRQTIDLDAPRRSAPEAKEETANARAKTAADAAPEPTVATAPAATTPTPAVSSPPGAAPSNPAPEPVARTTAPARAQPAATAGSATQAAATAESGWMVQLGSFGDESNARRQAARVTAVGQDARIYPFTTGDRTMYRVRVGGFATRARAEAAASSLSAHGLPAQIVAPE